MDSKLLEALLRLTADALKGSEEARNALGALGEAAPSSEAWSQWATAWLPKEGGRWGTRDVSELQSVMEESWRAIGVVPRYRYLELLERYEKLKEQLGEAEETVRNLRVLLAERGREQEARGMLDRWEESTRRALESQTEWMRSWTGGASGKPTKEDEK